MLILLNLKLDFTVLSDLDDEEGNAALEEKEALKLQRQMAEQLDDQDFGLDIFKVSKKLLTYGMIDQNYVPHPNVRRLGVGFRIGHGTNCFHCRCH